MAGKWLTEPENTAYFNHLIVWCPYKIRFFTFCIGKNQSYTGNTGFTDVLRPGLLLTKNAQGKFVQWGSVTSFAADKIQGINLMTLKMTRMGSNQDRWVGYVLLGGCIKEDGIIIPGETSAGVTGHAQATNIRTQLKYAFRFDDDPMSHLAS